MRRQLVTCYLVIGFVGLSSAQILNQDKNGVSTIFYQGQNISFDFTQPMASFNLNNLERRLTNDTLWVYELNVKGKSEEGIVNILKNGALVPSGAVTGRIGYTFDDGRGSGRQQVVFLEAEIKTTRLYTFVADSALALEKWFTKKDFSYRRVALGYNHEIKSWLFGLSLGYQYCNNIGDLTPDDYSFKEDFKIGNQSIGRSFSRSAYNKAEYKSYHTGVFNFDLIRFSNMSKKTNLAWNIVYVRSELLPTQNMWERIDLGTGLFFLNNKGKFVGGFYMEWADITSGRELGDHEFGNLSLGLVTRFSVSSIF